MSCVNPGVDVYSGTVVCAFLLAPRWGLSTSTSIYHLYLFRVIRHFRVIHQVKRLHALYITLSTELIIVILMKHIDNLTWVMLNPLQLCTAISTLIYLWLLELETGNRFSGSSSRRVTMSSSMFELPKTRSSECDLMFVNFW